MSRYIERAESIARLVDVNLQLLLDFRNLDDAALAAHWIPLSRVPATRSFSAGCTPAPPARP
jgi:uncharacterized alpha-E superfamily protein